MNNLYDFLSKKSIPYLYVIRFGQHTSFYVLGTERYEGRDGGYKRPDWFRSVQHLPGRESVFRLQARCVSVRWKLWMQVLFQFYVQGRLKTFDSRGSEHKGKYLCP